MFAKLWKILIVIFIVICFLIVPFAAPIAGWLTTAGFPLLAGLVTAAGSNLAWWALGAAGIGLAYMIDPATTAEAIGDIADVATEVVKAGGDAVQAAADVLVGVAGSAASGLVPVMLIGALGFLAYRSMSTTGESDKRVQSTSLPSQDRLSTDMGV